MFFGMGVPFLARNMPTELGEMRPITPASSNASLAAVSPKLREALSLPFGMPHFFDRFLLTSRIRGFPFLRRRYVNAPDSSIAVPCISGGVVIVALIIFVKMGEGVVHPVNVQ